MLTREQARAKYCPIKMAGSISAPANIEIEKKYLLCTANDCPKWVWACYSAEECAGGIKKKGCIEECLNINNPHRYGRWKRGIGGRYD